MDLCVLWLLCYYQHFLNMGIYKYTANGKHEMYSAEVHYELRVC